MVWSSPLKYADQRTMQIAIEFIRLAVLFSGVLVIASPVPTQHGDVVAVKPKDYTVCIIQSLQSFC